MKSSSRLLSSLQFGRNLVTRQKMTSSMDYCLESVKKNDYENFICTILLQNAARSNALAIRSFNVEIARVTEQVSQKTIALMRFKFWEDALDKCLGRDLSQVPRHPVAMELFKVNNRCTLSKRFLNNLISSRKDMCQQKTFASLDDMEKYSEKSVSNVLYLVLEGCCVKNVNADHAASHLGKAQGIVQQLRSIPLAKRIDFIPVPQDILIKHKVPQEEILRGRSSELLNECTYDIAVRAHQHLMKARSLMENVPKEGRPALLPAVPVLMYLERLQKVGYDVFHPSLSQRSWKLLPTIWMNNFRNRY